MPAVRITDVETYVLGDNWRNLVFARVITDEGLYGIGEATLQNRDEAVVAYLQAAKKRHVIGSDPFNIEDLWLRMYRDDFWRGGPVANTALSAVEIACWDIVGKALGVPVYRLLGGQCHERLKAYANGWYTGERTPEDFARRAKGVVAKGYRALKVDPFGAGTYEMEADEKRHSIALVEAIRDAVGPDVEIFIEMHGRFSPATAIEIARELEPFNPGWVEEPVPPEDQDALERAARDIHIPVATGERLFTRYEYARFFKNNVVDIIQPDIIHAGGIMELKKIAAMADAHYVMVAPHCSNGPACTAASVHFDFCTTNVKIQECFDDFAPDFVREAVPGFPRVKDGYFSPPEAPGLGIDLNLDVIKEHPYRFGHFNLFADDWQRRAY